MGHPFKMFVEFWSMTLGFICHSSPSGQERMCVLLDCFMLKPVLVPSLLCLSGFILKILFFINLGNSITIPLIWHLATIEVMWATIFCSKQDHTNHLLFLPRIKSPSGTQWTAPSFCVTHQVHPGPWANATLWVIAGSPVQVLGPFFILWQNQFSKYLNYFSLSQKLRSFLFYYLTQYFHQCIKCSRALPCFSTVRSVHG